jgi:hypothetical protein
VEPREFRAGRTHFSLGVLGALAALSNPATALLLPLAIRAGFDVGRALQPAPHFIADEWVDRVLADRLPGETATATPTFADYLAWYDANIADQKAGKLGGLRAYVLAGLPHHITESGPHDRANRDIFFDSEYMQDVSAGLPWLAAAAKAALVQVHTALVSATKGGDLAVLDRVAGRTGEPQLDAALGAAAQTAGVGPGASVFELYARLRRLTDGVQLTPEQLGRALKGSARDQVRQRAVAARARRGLAQARSREGLGGARAPETGARAALSRALTHRAWGRGSGLPGRCRPWAARACRGAARGSARVAWTSPTAGARQPTHD